MHEDYPNRDDANWMKHTISWFDGSGGKGGGVTIDYRPVHEYTLTDEIDYIKPRHASTEEAHGLASCSFRGSSSTTSLRAERSNPGQRLAETRSWIAALRLPARQALRTGYAALLAMT
jgi:hypothetical protein